MVVVSRLKRLLLNMAENMADQELQMQNPEPQNDGSDNESVSSIEQENTRHLSRLESERSCPRLKSTNGNEIFRT